LQPHKPAPLACGDNNDERSRSSSRSCGANGTSSRFWYPSRLLSELLHFAFSHWPSAPSSAPQLKSNFRPACLPRSFAPCLLSAELFELLELPSPQRRWPAQASCAARRRFPTSHVSLLPLKLSSSQLVLRMQGFDCVTTQALTQLTRRRLWCP
jgi:hypothetical protein